MRRLLLTLCILASPLLRAQLHPLPGSKSEPPVLCTGCLGNNFQGLRNAGLPTYQYAPPLARFVGRYVDSTSTASFQHIGFRTARAGHIRTTQKRVYIQIGSAIGAYSLEKFFAQKLPAGMVSVSGVKTGSRVAGVGRSPLERVAMWDGFVYPETRGSGWLVPFQDGQDRLGAGSPFDVDDRGYLYAAYSVFGWGIVKDDGRTDGSHFETIVQMIAGGVTTPSNPATRADSSGISPETIVAIKVGARYYAVVADQNGSHAVWDVTTPVAPAQVVVRASARPGKFGIRKWDRHDASGRLATVSGHNRVYIFDYASFISGQDPTAIIDQAASFTDVSFDETGNLWASEKLNRIWRFSPAGRTYSASTFSPHAGKFEHGVMHVNSGLVFVAGLDFVGGLSRDVRLLQIEAAGLRNLDLDGFFGKYYHRAPIGHAQPAGNTGVQADVQIVQAGGKVYGMYSVFGLGDVFEIQTGAPPVVVVPPVVTQPPPATCTCTCPCT